MKDISEENKKEFDLGCVLSITTGMPDVCDKNEDVLDLLFFLIKNQDPNDKVLLSIFANQNNLEVMRNYIISKYPQLKDIDKDKFKNLYGNDLEKGVKALKDEFGDTVVLEPMPREVCDKMTKMREVYDNVEAEVIADMAERKKLNDLSEREFDLATILVIIARKPFDDMKNTDDLIGYLTKNSVEQVEFDNQKNYNIMEEYIVDKYPQLEGLGKNLPIKDKEDALKKVTALKNFVGDSFALSPMPKELCEKLVISEKVVRNDEHKKM